MDASEPPDAALIALLHEVRRLRKEIERAAEVGLPAAREHEAKDGVGRLREAAG